MKTGLMVFIIGLIVSLVVLYVPIGDGLGNGYLALLIGYPLVLIGIIIVIISIIKNRKNKIQ